MSRPISPQISYNVEGESFISSGAAFPPSQEYRADMIWREGIMPRAEESGKWVLMPGEEEIDHYWETVEELFDLAAFRGAKSSTAKSSSHRDSYLICVYTDSDDIEEIERTGQILENEGLETEGYKPDSFTWLGIYPETLGEFGLESEFLYEMK